MPRVVFTRTLARSVTSPPLRVAGATVREALEAYFAVHPLTREHVLDEQGRLRRHVVAFADGEQVADREGLSDAVGPDTELQLVQALAGG